MNITIQYDDELETQVREGSPDPLGWITSVNAGEEYLVGGDDNDGMKEYVGSFLAGVVQSTATVIDGEPTMFRTGNGPVYVVFEPKNDHAVTLSLCYSEESAQSPSKRKPYEPQIATNEDELATEALRVTDEYDSFVRETNPELAESDSHRGLLDDRDLLQEKIKEKS